MSIFDLLGDLNNRYLKQRVKRQQLADENPRATWPAIGQLIGSAAIEGGSPVLRSQSGQAINLDWKDRIAPVLPIIPTREEIYPFRGLRIDNTGQGNGETNNGGNVA